MLRAASPGTASAIALAGSLLCAAAQAQTCAAPLPAYPTMVDQRSSCGQNLLPALNHGTTLALGDEVVYYLAPGHYEGGATVATLTNNESTATFEPSLFLCRAPCGTDSECVDANDSGTAGFTVVEIPQDELGYYLIVESNSPGCGNYSLVINGYFGDVEDAAR